MSFGDTYGLADFIMDMVSAGLTGGLVYFLLYLPQIRKQRKEERERRNRALR